MTTPYRLSFTTGGLFVPEAPVVVACYFTHRDWQKTRDQVRQDKLLQVRTDAAATRISKELVARLELLTEAELQALQELNLRTVPTCCGWPPAGATSSSTTSPLTYCASTICCAAVKSR